jgi:hypothetical protein
MVQREFTSQPGLGSATRHRLIRLDVKSRVRMNLVPTCCKNKPLKSALISAAANAFSSLQQMHILRGKMKSIAELFASAPLAPFCIQTRTKANSVSGQVATFGYFRKKFAAAALC